MTIINYLYIIVISGYYAKKEWQKWADEEILKKDEVDEWIYKISLAKDVDEFMESIYYPMFDECYYSNNEFSREDAIVGYYYMMYKERRISLYELINKLSDDDDISTSSSIHKKENFYELLNELNKRMDLNYKNELANKIEELLEPLKKIAEDQKKIIEFHQFIQ